MNKIEFHFKMWLFYERWINENPDEVTPIAMIVGDKLFLNDYNMESEIKDGRGVRILPKDGSYRRFIADSWYSDIDVQNL